MSWSIKNIVHDEWVVDLTTGKSMDFERFQEAVEEMFKPSVIWSEVAKSYIDTKTGLPVDSDNVLDENGWRK